MSEYVSFEDLLGKTIISIRGAELGSKAIFFVTADGLRYEMYHSQQCCESVAVEDMIGDIKDLIGSPILRAEERSNKNDPRPLLETKDGRDSYTWTFYELATIKGSVTLRWFGSSNGYYSESVTFEQT